MARRTAEEVMGDLGDEVIVELDEIARAGHAKYRTYPADVLIDHDPRAQAACIYSHMLAEADRHFHGRQGVRDFELRGLKLWLFEQAGVVVRLKKMDEDGRTHNYPTKQARDFDLQRELPGLPSPPVRLTAGYLLDPTGTSFVRSQIAMPIGRGRTDWCVAVIPPEERVAGEKIWENVTRQGAL